MVISDVLFRPETYLWSDALFVPKIGALMLSTECIVHDPDDVEDEDVDLPDNVIAAGFDYILSMQTVQSIISNAKQQDRGNEPEDLLLALNFFIQNDAFIDFTQLT